MSLVSVIMPAYNAAPWIAEAVGSVLAQTWRELEVIVVDDGSKDATAEVVAGIGDSRVRLIRQENRGAAAARNLGFVESNGDFIQYLDADDLLTPDKLLRQMEVLESAPEGAVASCGWGRFTGEASEVVVNAEPVWRVEGPIEWLVLSLSGGGMMQPGCWLVPRILIERAGAWDERLCLHDDGEFFTRVLLQATRNCFVEGPLVHYRTVEGSLSRRRSQRAVASAMEVCRSRHRHLLAVRDDALTRTALVQQYVQFAYEFHRDAPELVGEAFDAIRELGASPCKMPGGGMFRGLAAVLGFRNALRLKHRLAG